MIFLHAQLEKAGYAYLDWYLEASKRVNERLISLQETNKKLLETISEPKTAASTDSQGQGGGGPEDQPHIQGVVAA